ncbi:sugar ABC transporter permease [Clostridia bacterium]|nr:sugar ABC transporter permease [Clostridia bacterium]
MNNSKFGRSTNLKAAAYIALGVYTLVVAYPIVFLLTASLKSNSDFFTNLFGFPRLAVWKNYVTAWSVGKLGKYFMNSVIVTGVSVLGTTVAALMGGYALAKLRVPRPDTIMSVLMMFNFIPGIAIYISLFGMMSRFQLTSTRFGLILPYIAWNIPFSMYIFKQYFATLPQELIESGRIDGCGEFRAFFHIMLPLVTPAIATVIVFTFIGNWGELMWANIATAANINLMTLPVGLLNFKTEMGVQWGQYTAGITIVTVPLMIVFAYFQKYFVAGLTNGAVKG